MADAKKWCRSLTAVVLAFVLPLSGCGLRSHQKVNERNVDHHKYDILNYINITDFGENGDGYVEITPKDYSVNDFDSEKEYINVKKTIDAMELTYVTGGASGKSLKVSAPNKLSNGDTVQIKFEAPDEVDADICFDPYTYTVSHLGRLNKINLFDDNIVTVAAKPDGSLITSIRNSSLDDELADSLVYTAEYENSGETIEKNKSVVDLTVNLSDDFYKKNPRYSDLKEYLAKHGEKADETGSCILTNIVEDINWSAVDRDVLTAFLCDHISRLLRNKQRYDSSLVDDSDIFAESSGKTIDTTSVSIAYVYRDPTYQDTTKVSVEFAHLNDTGATVYNKCTMNIGMIDNGIVGYNESIGGDSDTLDVPVESNHTQILVNYVD